MRRTITFIVAIVAGLFAFVLLTIVVDTQQVEGAIVGTLVVAPDTSQSNIHTTTKILRVAGAFWAAVSLFSFWLAVRPHPNQ